MTDTTGDKHNKYYQKRRKRTGANRQNSGVMRVKHSTHVLVKQWAEAYCISMADLFDIAVCDFLDRLARNERGPCATIKRHSRNAE